MKMIISIPDEEYEEIICDEVCGLNTLTRAIAHGTPLPKGHGRLIDENEIYKRLRPIANNAELDDILLDIPIVIEADK